MKIRALRPAVALVAALTLVLAGCSDDSGGSGAPSEGDLADALLTSSDVPDGFTEQEVEDDDDDENPFANTCLEDVQELDDLVGDPDEDAETEFVSESDVAEDEVTASLSYYDDEDELSDAFDDLATALGDCPSVQTTAPNGAVIDVQVSIDDSVTLEDADNQLRIDLDGTISLQGQTFEIALATVGARIGNFVSGVGANQFAQVIDREGGVIGQLDGLVETQWDRVLDLD